MGIFDACYGCTDRVVGCHSTCEKYETATERNEELKAAKNADKDCRAYAYKIKADNMAKSAMKKKHKVDVRRNYR